MARRSWAMGLAERCESIDRDVRQHNERTDIVNRAAGVALENLKSHVGTLESRFQEAQAWARDLLKEQQAALDGWRRAMNTLGNIPARREFSFLGRPSTPKKDQDTSTASLRDFVDVDDVHKAGTEAAAASPRFARQVEDVQRSVAGITADTQRLVQEALPSSVEEADGLLHEVDTVTKKISSD
ncbi:oligomeric, coiled-coil, peripheral membrane protein, partial [Elasticomyces elasticus]